MGTVALVQTLPNPLQVELSIVEGAVRENQDQIRRDRGAPRIVGAVVQDGNGDFRADRVRLTFSERIRHPRDADGKYPFVVAGYRISSVAAAAGKSIVIALVEKEYAIDTSRVYLMGHSMGGMGAWYLGQKYADKWAGLGVMSGGFGYLDAGTLRKCAYAGYGLLTGADWQGLRRSF